MINKMKNMCAAISISASLIVPVFASEEKAKEPEISQEKLEELKSAFGSLKIDLKNIKPDTIVARVGDKSFTAEDVAVAMQQTLRAAAQNMGPEFAQTLTPEILFLLAREQVVDFYLLEKEVDKNKARLMKDPEVQEAIAESTKSVLQSSLLKEAVDKYVTKDKIRDKYTEFSKEFPKDAEEVRLRMIVVKTEPEAKEIIKQLNGGADFLKLAREKSIEKKTAERDGDLGYVSEITKDQLLPGFSVIFEKPAGKHKITTGGITQEAIKSPMGYHILKVEDRRPLKKPKLAELEPMIKQLLQQEAAQKYQEQLKKGAGNIQRLHPNTGKPMGSLEEELKVIQEKIKDTLEKAKLEEVAEKAK
jgi:peptidyl-prolyl cis-trans isomerase C